MTCLRNGAMGTGHLTRRRSISPAALLLLFQLLPWGPSPAALTRETRGLWVSGEQLASPDDVRAVVSLAKHHRLNTLFVQVRRRGDSYHSSSLAPPPAAADEWEPGFDPLRAVLGTARAAGLTVHAWLNMYLAWSSDTLPTSSGHVVSAHPDWLLRDGRGLPLLSYDTDELGGSGYDGLYLDPGSAAARRHLALLVHELLCDYDVDGVHLDYIRYPTRDCGFGPEARRLLRAVLGREMTRAPRTDESTEAIHLWRVWRADQVTRLVQKVRRAVSVIRPEACITAAVIPDARLAYERYGQDWVGWLNQGLIDAAIAMTYAPDPDLVRAQLEAGRGLTGPGGLIAGFGLFNQSVQELTGKIEIARDVGCDGIVLLGLEQLTDDPAYRYGLSLGPFRHQTLPYRCRGRELNAFRPPRIPWRLPREITRAEVPARPLD